MHDVPGGAKYFDYLPAATSILTFNGNAALVMLHSTAFLPNPALRNGLEIRDRNLESLVLLTYELSCSVFHRFECKVHVLQRVP